MGRRHLVCCSSPSVQHRYSTRGEPQCLRTQHAFSCAIGDCAAPRLAHASSRSTAPHILKSRVANASQSDSDTPTYPEITWAHISRRPFPSLMFMLPVDARPKRGCTILALCLHPVMGLHVPASGGRRKTPGTCVHSTKCTTDSWHNHDTPYKKKHGNVTYLMQASCEKGRRLKLAVMVSLHIRRLDPPLFSRTNKGGTGGGSSIGRREPNALGPERGESNARTPSPPPPLPTGVE